MDEIEEIEETVREASSASAIVLPSRNETETKTVTKPEKKPRQYKSKKRDFPNPDDFKEHPFAKVLNEAADWWVTKKGAGEKVGFGEAWVATMDYYFAGNINHPLSFAVIASVEVAAAGAALRYIQKKEKEAKAKKNVTV